MIIVTGANGFIGSAIVAKLLESNPNSTIIAVDTISLEQRATLLANKNYSLFLSKDEIWDFLQRPSTRQQVTWIIHMGANSSTTETNWPHLYENNTFYTQRLFEWCAQNKKNFIYASSAATYGAGELGYSDETDSEQLRPLNLYGESKVLFDRWVLRQPQTPPHWYGLKFFNVYGPNEYHKGAMASVCYKAFHQIRSTGKLKLFKSYLKEYKDGEQKRDFVYVKDVANWTIELMQKTPSDGIYNNGYGQARTWLDLGKAIFKSLQLPENFEFIEMPGDIKNQYQYFTEANMKKWQQAKLSAPSWPLEKGVADYIQNYLCKDEKVW